MVAFLFLLYTAEVAAPNYFVGSLRFDLVGGGILFWFPTTLVNILSYVGVYEVTERIRRDLIFGALVLHCETDTYWFSFGCFDNFVCYDFARVLYASS